MITNLLEKNQIYSYVLHKVMPGIDKCIVLYIATKTYTVTQNQRKWIFAIKVFAKTCVVMYVNIYNHCQEL